MRFFWEFGQKRFEVGHETGESPGHKGEFVKKVKRARKRRKMTTVSKRENRRR